MRKQILKDDTGNIFVGLFLVTIVIIICSVVFLPKLIHYITKSNVPMKGGDYLTYDFRRGYGSDGYTDQIEFKFKDPQDDQIKFTITEIEHDEVETRFIPKKYKFKDQGKSLYLMGVAPVWFPKERLAKGGNVRGYRILEHKEWNGWDVWVAGEPKMEALYYERATGYLVGFEFVTPESVEAKLIDTNIEGL